MNSLKFYSKFEEIGTIRFVCQYGKDLKDHSYDPFNIKTVMPTGKIEIGKAVSNLDPEEKALTTYNFQQDIDQSLITDEIKYYTHKRQDNTYGISQIWKTNIDASYIASFIIQEFESSENIDETLYDKIAYQEFKASMYNLFGTNCKIYLAQSKEIKINTWVINHTELPM